MRSDYPNAELINKVNSEWINKVLVHPELCGDDPADDSDLVLQRAFTVRQAGPPRREPTQIVAELSRLSHPEPSIAVARVARSSRPRSVKRRVAERLALGVAALGLGAAVWIALGSQDSTNAVSGQATSTSFEPVAGADATMLRATEPAWLSPETLYATAIAPPPTRRVEAPLFLPRTGR